MYRRYLDTGSGSGVQSDAGIEGLDVRSKNPIEGQGGHVVR